MVNPRVLGVVAAVAVGLVLPATALALKLRAAGHGKASAAMPRSTLTLGLPAIGALYASAETTEHGCSASVVDSPRGNTLITAAHCVSGSGAGMVFAPGEHGGDAPYGRWTVTSAHVAPRWVKGQDPHDDVAFLTVAPQDVGGRLTDIQQVTGGYPLGSTARAGQPVSVTAYPVGTTNDPITCTAKVYLTGGFPSFNCRGYVNGTSGAPWLRATSHGLEIVGLIGGLHQGGCVPDTSYSPRLAVAAHATYRRASTGVTADVLPAPGGNGCV